jgi:hypothetical protein
MRLYQAAQTGHNEYTVLLGFLYRCVYQVLEKCSNGLIVHFHFLGQVADELRFGHA